MGITQIGIEVGRSYSRTFGGDTLVVTALASPWAEKRIAELEAMVRKMAKAIDEGDEGFADTAEWESLLNDAARINAGGAIKD